RIEAFLFDRAGQTPLPVESTKLRDALAHRLRIRALVREPLDQRMLWREQDERRAVNRIDASGEDFDFPTALHDGELEARAFGAPNPVPLHQHDLFRPFLQRVEPLQ